MSDQIQTRADGSRFVDMTPTWESIFPVYFEALTNGTHEGQGIARAELLRAASALDKHNALAKEARAQPDTTPSPTKPADNGREASVEACLIWAQSEGHSGADFALSDYCGARGLSWSTDLSGVTTIKGES